MKKVLYLISNIKDEEAESKLVHLLNKIKDSQKYEICVGILGTSHPLYQELTSLKLNVFFIDDLSALSKLFLENFYHVVHFYGSKKILKTLQQATPHYTQIIETVFNDSLKSEGTSAEPAPNVKRIFVTEELKKQWNVEGAVIPHGVDTALLLREDRDFLRSKYNISSNIKAVGLVPKIDEEFNVGFILQLALKLQKQNAPFKLVLFYDGPVKSILIGKIAALKLDSYICFADAKKVALGFIDLYLDISSENELRSYTLQALCYKIPFILRNTPENNRLLNSAPHGILISDDNVTTLYNYLITTSKIDRKTISLPEKYHSSIVAKSIEQVYDQHPSPIVKTVVASKEPLYCIVPYGIYGGAEVYLENHIKRGTFQNVHLIFLMPGNALQDKMAGKYPCTLVQGFPGLGNFLTANKAKQVLFYNSASVYHLLKRLKDALGLNIIEVVHSLHQWSDSMHGHLRSSIDKVYTVSAKVARDWEIAQYEVLPPVIDDLKFKIPKVPHTGIVIGTVARFSAEKNLRRVVDIASYLDDNYRFIIVGKDGGTKRDIQNYINEKKLNKRVVIKDHSDEIEKEYATFDLFLLTSNIEGTPLTILEALAADLPVFAPDVGSIKEMLSGKDGHVFSQEESNQTIAEKIRERKTLISKPECEIVAPPTQINSSKRKTIVICQPETMSLRALKTAHVLKDKYNVIGLAERAPSSFFGWGDHVFEKLYITSRMELELKEIVKREKVDYFYYHNPGEQKLLKCIPIAKQNGVKCIYDINDSISLNSIYAPTKHHTQQVTDSFIAIEQSLVNQSNALVVPSLQVAEYFQKKTANPIITLPNYFVDFGSPIVPKSKFSDKDGKIHVGYIGGINATQPTTVYYMKDIVTLLLRNPNIVIHIFPTHSMEATFFRKLSDRVKVSPKTAPLVAVEALSQCDIGLCIFNLNFWNNPLCLSSQPNKMYDYLAAGIPLMAHTSMPNITNFIAKHSAGIIFDGPTLDFMGLSLDTIKQIKIGAQVSKEINMINHRDDLIKFLESL